MTTAESIPFDLTAIIEGQVIPFPTRPTIIEGITAEEREFAAVRALMLGGSVVAFEKEDTEHDRQVKRNEQILANSLPREARHSAQWYDISQ